MELKPANDFTPNDLPRYRQFLKHAKLQVNPHQLQGVDWAVKRENPDNNQGLPFNVTGGIIADDMGLGKTIQILGLCMENKTKKTLIVLPLALLAQWEHIILSMIPGCNPYIFRGKERKTLTQPILENAYFVLTTYHQIAHHSTLHEIEWNRIIFDEAHHLRNSNTQVFRGAQRLMVQNWWFVTGTPIQNYLKDFHALCQLLGIPEEFYKDEDNMQTIRNKFILRRTKFEAGITLPTLTINKKEIDWKDEQELFLAKKFHSGSQRPPQNDTEEVISNIAEKITSIPITSMLRAKQLCTLPELIKPQIEKLYETNQIDEGEFNTLNKILTQNSKMKEVIGTLVQRKDNNAPKIVFCQFRGEIDYLAQKLRDNGIENQFYDGRTTEEDRHKILTETYPVLILQMQTACEGINLQQYQEIYFVTPSWNPALEDQAVARCHRIGQTKPVQVFGFYMKSFPDEVKSMDIRTKNTQEAKRQIIQDLLQDKK